ncbi:MAG: Lrp/AsnC family transcriptional regulator [Candidatus Woesearchaeota archaeon]
MESMTSRERQILLELIKNARTSDQEIARRIGTSRPTVLKIRRRLEKKYIKNYSATIDFSDLGLNVIATTFFRWDDFSKKKEMKRVFDYIRKLPFVIRFCNGVGMGSMTMIIVSVHVDFREYERFYEDLQEEGGDNIREAQAFISSTKDMYKKYDNSSVLIKRILEQA